MLSDERIREIKERCEKATKGPWTYSGKTGDGKRQFVESVDDDTWQCLRAEIDSDDCDYDMAVANAHFIAASRTDIPDLLAEIERLRGELAKK